MVFKIGTDTVNLGPEVAVWSCSLTYRKQDKEFEISIVSVS